MSIIYNLHKCNIYNLFNCNKYIHENNTITKTILKNNNSFQPVHYVLDKIKKANLAS
jgi:hypothetical protein